METRLRLRQTERLTSIVLLLVKCGDSRFDSLEAYFALHHEILAESTCAYL